MTPAILLFISGAAALIYQTIWVKQLALVVGVDVYAVTTAVSAFFAGLAFGGAVFGRWADRMKRPLNLYALLEYGVAFLGYTGTAILAYSPRIFAYLQDTAGPAAWFLPFTLIGLPAFLMGGTLPVLVRALRPDNSSVGRASGFLYAANTAGAVAGALITPFFLIPALGVAGAASVAAAGNIIAAIWAQAAAAKSRQPHQDPTKEPGVPITGEVKIVLILYALAGGVALGYEVIWSQAIIQFMSTRAYAFAVMLAVYLTGVALGSFFYGRFTSGNRRPWLIFGLLISGAGLASILIFWSIDVWLPACQDAIGKTVFKYLRSDMAANSFRFAFAALVMILPPTLLLGAAFPAAIRLVGKAVSVGRDVGLVAALNTAGGIAGTFLTGFVLMPNLGMVRTMALLAISAVVIGGIAMVYGSRRNKLLLIIPALMLIMVIAAAFMTPYDKFGRLLAEARKGSLVFYKEGPGGAVAVIEQKASHMSFHRLYIQGASNSGDSMTSMRYMRLQALLPLLIHNGEPRSAMVIGLGTGITGGALLQYPPLKKRVCVELLPSVVRASSRFEGNYNVGRDSGMEVRLRDGRHELLLSKDVYDLITLEPPPPTSVGVVNLYSREFYELCRERLKPKGLIAQWWPLPTQNDEDSQSLVRSFIDIFPYATVWSTELHEMLLIGSMAPIELDAGRIEKRFFQPDTARCLSEIGVSSPAALLASYITDRNGLERYAEDAPPVTDNHPRLEYADWVRDGEFSRVFKRILKIRRDIPIKGGNKDFRAAVMLERRRLMRFYESCLYALDGDYDQWAVNLRSVIREDRRNPYYLWFIGKKAR